MDTSATSNAPSSTSTASPSAKSPNWDQIRFPFDPQLQSHSDLATHPVGPLTGWHDLRATAFQMRVWEALKCIPRGETRTYSEIACVIGQPTAVRAVARACATNPVAVVIPCHRVVGADGKLSGYRWGVERKQRLLEMEKQ